MPWMRGMLCQVSSVVIPFDISHSLIALVPQLSVCYGLTPLETPISLIPASLANDMRKMDPISWANVSLSNSPVAPVTVSKAADTTTNATVPRARVALPIACRSLDSPMIPAGRSVKALASFSTDTAWMHTRSPTILERPYLWPAWTNPPSFPVSVWTDSCSYHGHLVSTLSPRPVFSVVAGLPPFPQWLVTLPGLCWRTMGSWSASKPESLPAVSLNPLALLASLDLTGSSRGMPPASTPGSRLTWTLALGSERLRPAIRT
jgi:hypothetical protein